MPNKRGALGSLETGEWRIWHVLLFAIVGLICLFLIGPILVIIPLSFTGSNYPSFPIDSYSLHWYREFLGDRQWRLALTNSLVIASITTVTATSLGTAAALGVWRCSSVWRRTFYAVFLSPLFIPMVVSSIGMFYFFAFLKMIGSMASIVIAHTILATPFVVSTVSGALSKFDPNLELAGLSLGASPARVFWKVILPAISSGIFSGGIFAFITSWDEVIAVIFLATPDQFTLPRQMWAGLREDIAPTLLAAAVCITAVSVVLAAIVAVYSYWRSLKLKTQIN